MGVVGDCQNHYFRRCGGFNVFRETYGSLSQHSIELFRNSLAVGQIACANDHATSCVAKTQRNRATFSSCSTDDSYYRKPAVHLSFLLSRGLLRKPCLRAATDIAKLTNHAKDETHVLKSTSIAKARDASPK